MITRTCLLLAWELLRGGTPIASGHAANDVVVGRGAIARVLPSMCSWTAKTWASYAPTG